MSSTRSNCRGEHFCFEEMCVVRYIGIGWLPNKGEKEEVFGWHSEYLGLEGELGVEEFWPDWKAN